MWNPTVVPNCVYFETYLTKTGEAVACIYRATLKQPYHAVYADGHPAHMAVAIHGSQKLARAFVQSQLLRYGCV